MKNNTLWSVIFNLPFRTYVQIWTHREAFVLLTFDGAHFIVAVGRISLMIARWKSPFYPYDDGKWPKKRSD